MSPAPIVASFYGIGLGEALVILTLLGGLALWIWMIVDCATKEEQGSVRAMWIVVVAVFGIFGALLYLFVRKMPRRAKRLRQP